MRDHDRPEPDPKQVGGEPLLDEDDPDEVHVPRPDDELVDRTGSRPGGARRTSPLPDADTADRIEQAQDLFGNIDEDEV